MAWHLMAFRTCVVLGYQRIDVKLFIFSLFFVLEHLHWCAYHRWRCRQKSEIVDQLEDLVALRPQIAIYSMPQYVQKIVSRILCRDRQVRKFL